jgi:exodeoxyribonuclease VII large subunit
MLVSMKKSSSNLLNTRKKEIEHVEGGIDKQLESFFVQQKAVLLHIEKNVNILDPIHILRRGFTMTLCNGKALKSFTEVKPGDIITSVFVDGQVVSEVKSH